MGIISDQLDTLNQEVEERQGVRDFRGHCQSITDTLLTELDKMSKIKSSNDFSTIPNEVKQVFLRWETILKDARTALQNDSDIVEAYQWRP